MNKHPGIKNITEAIKYRMTKANTQNISIYIPGLEGKELKSFRKRFKSVTIEPFGYARFEL